MLSRKKLLQVGCVLQDYVANHPGAPFDIPSFVIIGMQSSGKTRMLSTIGQKKIGGAEQNKTGTRCPVSYKFRSAAQSAYRAGFAEDMKTVEDHQIHNVVANCMKRLDEAERAGGEGFSETAFHVEIQGPEQHTFVAIDLPGIKPKADDPANVHIRRLYRSYLRNPNAVPILMTSFPVNMDSEFTKNELRGIVDFVGGDAAASRALKERAIVIVSRLDSVRQNISNKSCLADFKARVQECNICSDNVIFLSLKPELLDGRKQPLIPNEEAAPFAVVNDYFATTLSAQDAEKIPQFREQLGCAADEFLLGIPCAVERIEDTLQKAMQSSLSSITSRLRVNLGTAIAAAKPVMGGVNKDKAKQLAEEYAILTAGVLGGTSQVDNSNIRDNFLSCAAQYPELVDRNRINSAIGKLMAQLKMTFAREEELVKKFAVFEDCGWDDLLKGGKSALRPGDYLESVLNDSLCSGAAAQRIIGLYALSIQVYPLPPFSKTDILNFAGSVDMNGRRGFSPALALRKMVSEYQTIVFDSMSTLIRWCARLYAIHACPVCEAVGAATSLLSEYPRLRDYVNTKLTGAYMKWFDDAATIAIKTVKKHLHIRFGALKIDEPLTLIRLLGSAGLTRAMMQHTAVPVNGEPPEAPEAEEDVQATKKPAAPTSTKTKFKAMKSKLCGAAWRLFKRMDTNRPDMVKNVFDFFSEKIACSAHDFAMMEPMPMKDMLREELLDSKKIAKLNDTARMLARVINGLSLMDLVSVIEEAITRPALQLHHAILSSLRDVLHNLDKSPALLPYLMSDDTFDRLEKAKKLSAQLSDLSHVCKSINEALKDTSFPAISTKLAEECQKSLSDKLPEFAEAYQRSCGCDITELDDDPSLTVRMPHSTNLDSGGRIGNEEFAKEYMEHTAALEAELARMQRGTESRHPLDDGELRSSRLQAENARLLQQNELLMKQIQSLGGEPALLTEANTKMEVEQPQVEGAQAALEVTAPREAAQEEDEEDEEGEEDEKLDDEEDKDRKEEGQDAELPPTQIAFSPAAAAAV